MPINGHLKKQNLTTFPAGHEDHGKCSCPVGSRSSSAYYTIVNTATPIFFNPSRRRIKAS